MAVLIDTSVVIAAERRGLPPEDAIAVVGAEDAIAVVGAEDAIAVVGAEDAAMASITASELLIGVHRADSPARRLRREAFVEAILEALPVIAFDLRIARVYAQLSALLAAAGQPIGAHDLLIAATALADGSAVLTLNMRGFGRVPGLVVRQPDW